MVRPFLIAWIVACLAGPAWPCSVVGPLPSAEALVRDAEVVARVRAEGLSSTPGRSGAMAESPTQVRFAVLEILKGSLPSATIEFNGSLTDRDDHNRGPVPYGHVRPGGSAGCFALEYRPRAEVPAAVAARQASVICTTRRFDAVLDAYRSHQRAALRRCERCLVRLGVETTSKALRCLTRRDGPDAGRVARALSRRRGFGRRLSSASPVVEYWRRLTKGSCRSRWPCRCPTGLQ